MCTPSCVPVAMHRTAPIPFEDFLSLQHHACSAGREITWKIVSITS